MNCTVSWQTASPLWEPALTNGDQRRFRQPAILRFARDSFMEDLSAQLRTAPEGLREFVAKPETWSKPGHGWTESDDPDNLLKVFQPSHGRFYLISATLVCRVTGLPDKGIDPGCDERAGFVVRRLLPRDDNNPIIRPSDPATFVEAGWVNGAWVTLADAATAADGEERLPMFPLTFNEPVRPIERPAGRPTFPPWDPLESTCRHASLSIL